MSLLVKKKDQVVGASTINTYGSQRNATVTQWRTDGTMSRKVTKRQVDVASDTAKSGQKLPQARASKESRDS